MSMSFSDPSQNINQLNLSGGEVIADFGSGVGFYTLPVARRLKELAGEGKVYAIEIQKEMLARLRQTAENESLTNIETIWGDIDEPGGSKLGDGACDIVLVTNLLFQSENKSAVLREANRVLNSGGRIMVIDWSESFGNLGPTPEMVVSQSAVEGLLSEAGFRSIENITAGEHHWGLIATK